MTEAAPKIEELLETRARERDVLLLATLVHVPFDGWTMRAVTAGVADAGYPADMALRAFPDGMEEMIAHFSRWADRRMVEELAHRNLAEMKIRERIKACVQVRLEILAPHREAVRKALAFLALPGHQALTTKLTYETVNAMWYEAGDRSTDYNFYTKRGLLAAVLGSTVLCWLADESDDFEDTWAFLDRRIDDVLRIPKITGRFKKAAARLPSPVRLARRFGTLRSTLQARMS